MGPWCQQGVRAMENLVRIRNIPKSKILLLLRKGWEIGHFWAILREL